MKNIKIKVIASVVIIAVIVTVVVISLNAGKSGSLALPSSFGVLPVSSTTTPSNASSASASTNKQPVVSSNKPSTNSSMTSGTYQNYINQYYSTKNACDAAATSQFTKLYGSTIGSSALLTYYNSTTGTCLVKISGSIQPTGSATTTNIIYFRNVSSNSLLADCSQISGKNTAPGPWQCTNRTNGQGINIDQFNEFISTFISP